MTNDKNSNELPISAQLIAQTMFELRCEQVKLVDLRGLSDVADYYVVGTCASEAQMQAILTALQVNFKKQKISTLGVEYKAGVRWAVFDAVDTMAHLFEEQAREEYSLEKLWKDGKVTELAAADFITDSVGTDSGDEFI